ncbi:hypothetical protein QYM36_005554, partial [Artemia franciscana]
MCMCNEKVERKHRELALMLGIHIYSKQEPNHWDDHLPFVVFAINTTYSATLGDTPVFKQYLTYPKSCMESIVNDYVHYNLDQYKQEMIMRMKKAMEQVAKNVEKAKLKSIGLNNGNTRANDSDALRRYGLVRVTLASPIIADELYRRWKDSDIKFSFNSEMFPITFDRIGKRPIVVSLRKAPGEAKYPELAGLLSNFGEVLNVRRKKYEVKAYDSVGRVILRVLMERKYGMSRQAVTRFENPYKDPKGVVKVKGELTTETEMEKALRQGDPLSPWLFENYVDPLLIFELQKDILKRFEREVWRFIWKGKVENLAMNMTTVRIEVEGLGVIDYGKGNGANLDKKQGYVLLNASRKCLGLICVTFETPEDIQVLKDIKLKRNDYEDPLTAFTREAGTSKLIKVPGTLDFSERLITKNWKAQIAPSPEGILWNQLYKMKSEEDTKTVWWGSLRSLTTSCFMTDRHTAENICKDYRATLRLFDISGKNSAMVHDRGSNIVKACHLDCLDSKSRDCIAHGLHNLTTVDGIFQGKYAKSFDIEATMIARFNLRVTDYDEKALSTTKHSELTLNPQMLESHILKLGYEEEEVTASELDVVNDQASVERRNTEQHPKRRKETYINRKKKHTAGQEYTAQKTQKVVPVKELKEFSCKCKLEYKAIDQDAQKAIFNSFWLLGKELSSMESQRMFILNCLTKKPVSRRTTSPSSSRRQNSLCYTLEVN